MRLIYASDRLSKLKTVFTFAPDTPDALTDYAPCYALFQGQITASAPRKVGESRNARAIRAS